MGGLSVEREVSLRTGAAVQKALVERGFDAVGIDVGPDIDGRLRAEKIEIAFNALHGKFGEDGCIQGLLELQRSPYTGSDLLSSALAMNKAKAKEVFRLYNIPTPPYYTIRRDDIEQLSARARSRSLPVFVKPVAEGSSVGGRIAGTPEELEDAVRVALTFDNEVLVEKYIPGMEVSVGVLDGEAIGAVEIVPKLGAFYDYASKYTPGGSEYHIPPRLSETRREGVLRLAEQAHRALGCGGVTRVDFIVSDGGNEWVLELNTLPGMTETSLIPKLAAARSISFGDLCEGLLWGAALGGVVQFRRPARLGELIPSLDVAARVAE
ncbi:MAG: D-alanine--D-alanine ligase [Deltaproteobacteria bacterium]|nr:D-alanine--D-alanine ligase [Deltaproteobacteria bacterium]